MVLLTGKMATSILRYLKRSYTSERLFLPKGDATTSSANAEVLKEMERSDLVKKGGVK